MSNLKITQKAIDQIRLILKNDFTLTGKFLRVQITGKECDGFTYSVGFHNIHKDDYKFACPQLGENKFLIMDPFSSFYLQDFTLDFIQDYENDLEGFEVINHDQKEFHGKFWKKEPHKVPQLQKS
ncbi:MAG: hypothetical protein VYD54_08555 [Bdellovibrionota bacterium]|nr:hypothetical protein [Bdellovibrionota bacterium]